ncbi:hypothetical protein BJY04DRAFT_148587 [Aspergillus karnatakaensis]|uniref:uncharacterized protein n=1 Tax=Aspergillus karnatakaensis TaxID=1810916 RepID=UPI003CCCBE65
MPFEFIDNSVTIDRATRKRIRTRAATGKNANRTLARPSKVTALKTNAAVPFLAPASLQVIRGAVDDSIEDDEGGIQIGIQAPVGDGISVPVYVPVKSRSLVREALFFFCGVRHIQELDGALESPDVTSTIWVRYFFVDEAYFHCSLATSILCSKNLLHETAQGMYHIARTYRLVQQRLMSSEATSDMTISVLVIMSQYERLQGQYERGYIHMQGLRRMIDLRGGIVQLSRECTGVIQKVLRADLEYALQLGQKTLFGLEAIEVLHDWGHLRSTDVRDGGGGEVDWFLQKNIRDDLWLLYDEMRRASKILNDANAGRSRKLDAVEFHNMLLLFGHRLLEISPLGDSSVSQLSHEVGMNVLEKAVHLSLIAFLVTFLTGLDHRIPDKPLLSQGLRLAVQSLAASVRAGQVSRPLQSVLLWTFYIGSVVEFKPSDDEWLIPTTTSTMQALDISTWEDVKELLTMFPWVNAVHDRAGTALSSTQKMLDFNLSIHFDQFL